MKTKYLILIALALLLFGCATAQPQGTPQSKATCAEQGGNICKADEVCLGGVLSTSDSELCCSIPCGNAAAAASSQTEQACIPGESKCGGNAVLACNYEGTWYRWSCTYGCANGECIKQVQTASKPNELRFGEGASFVDEQNTPAVEVTVFSGSIQKEYSRADDTEPLEVARAGYVYYIFDVQFKNLGSHYFWYYGGDFYLMDKDGRKYEWGTYYGDDDLRGADLPSYATDRGKIMFEVPENIVEPKLVYNERYSVGSENKDYAIIWTFEKSAITKE